MQTSHDSETPAAGQQVKLNQGEISFRLLSEEDLPLMHKWLNTDFVIEWYEKRRFTIEEVSQKYLPKIRGTEPENRSAIRAYEKAGFKYVKVIPTAEGNEYLMELHKDAEFAHAEQMP